MLYRALSNLDAGKTKIRKGQVFPQYVLTGPVLDKLTRLGRISRVSTPPLSVLPGWSKRAEKLARIGVETAEQFVLADDADLKKAMRASPERVKYWKEEILDFLSAPKDARR